MKALLFTRPNNLRRLHEDLLAAIPALRPVPAINSPIPGSLMAVMDVESAGDAITLKVPDGADEAAIAAVVAAHDPTPDVPPPVPQFDGDSTTADQVADAVTQLRAYLALATPTNAQTITAFKLLIRVVLFVLRRMF